MVHSSLSGLGFVAGGAHAVVLALVEAVGASGTLMMPTHSTHLTDPAGWENPPVPATWWDAIRDETPAFDPDLTPTRAMGAIVDCFRHVPGVQRSGHPTVSAAAVGPNAAALVHDHQLDHGLGEGSPQARLYDLDGHVLLLGVTHTNNTSLHLSEYRAAPEAGLSVTTESAPIWRDGQRVWVSYATIAEDDSDFGQVGDAFAASGAQGSGPVGAGTAHFMRARDIVDFGASWMREHRR